MKAVWPNPPTSGDSVVTLDSAFDDMTDSAGSAAIREGERGQVHVGERDSIPPSRSL
jgi:hypothetical protein